MINNNVNYKLIHYYSNLISQNKTLEPIKEQNLNSSFLNQNSTQSLNSQNTTQNTASNSQNAKISNLVIDKSQATSEVLGYGVDKDGYFTSDFNEKAGIPKDYKISADLIENLNKALTTKWVSAKPLFYEVDLASEIGAFYKENLQSLDTFGKNFDKNQIQEKFKLTLKDNFTKSEALLGTFMNDSWVKIQNGTSTLLGKAYGLDEKINQKDMQEFYTFMQKNQIKDPLNIEKSSFKHLISDEYMGLDRERSKLQGFVSYAVDFKLDPSIVQKASDFLKEFDKLLSEDLSLDKFKEKYLDFKQRHDEFVKEFEVAMGDNLLVKDISKEFENKPFKPIQGKSQNTQTYTREDIAKDFFLNFLEAQKMKGTDILELLEKLHSANVKVDIKA